MAIMYLNALMQILSPASMMAAQLYGGEGLSAHLKEEDTVEQDGDDGNHADSEGSPPYALRRARA